MLGKIWASETPHFILSPTKFPLHIRFNMKWSCHFYCIFTEIGAFFTGILLYRHLIKLLYFLTWVTDQGLAVSGWAHQSGLAGNIWRSYEIAGVHCTVSLANNFYYFVFINNNTRFVYIQTGGCGNTKDKRFIFQCCWDFALSHHMISHTFLAPL